MSRTIRTRSARRSARATWDGPTAGPRPGFVQANLVVLPVAYASDFQLFCDSATRAPARCRRYRPRLAPSRGAAPGADLRTDLPRYRVYRDGAVADEVTDVRAVWRDDLVSFLLGC